MGGPLGTPPSSPLSLVKPGREMCLPPRPNQRREVSEECGLKGGHLAHLSALRRCLWMVLHHTEGLMS